MVVACFLVKAFLSTVARRAWFCGTLVGCRPRQQCRHKWGKVAGWRWVRHPRNAGRVITGRGPPPPFELATRSRGTSARPIRRRSVDHKKGREPPALEASAKKLRSETSRASLLHLMNSAIVDVSTKPMGDRRGRRKTDWSR